MGIEEDHELETQVSRRAYPPLNSPERAIFELRLGRYAQAHPNGAPQFMRDILRKIQKVKKK